MKRDFIVASALGEALGIAGVALAFTASSRGLVATVPAILLAGAWEGLCLGAAQALVLQRAGISRPRWVGATVFIAVLGYAGSLAAGAGTSPDDGASPPLAVLLAGAVALGLLLGLLLGAAQAWAARSLLSRRAWLWRSAVGWALAMPCIFAGSAIVSGDWPLSAIAATGTLSGLAAGLLLGLVTAPATPA